MTQAAKPSRLAADQKTWRKSLKLLVWPVACYAGIIALLMIFENRLLFLACPATTDWQPPPAQATVEDVWLQTSDGRMHAWWIVHPGAEGALLYFHGNAGNLSHRSALATALMQSLGVSVLLVDYPGYGKSEGKPTE